MTRHFLLDMSHVAGRTITGIERMAIELFGDARVPGVAFDAVTARGRWSMLWAQLVRLPLRALRRRAAVVCPGFPPSIPLMLIARRRVVACIHDLFLLTHTDTLSSTGRWYMRPAFRFCLRRGRRFIVFSETMRGELRDHVATDAQIAVYRPEVRNVFALTSTTRDTPPAGAPLHLLSIGTVEPRKNYRQAAAIRTALSATTGRAVTLHTVGRAGWGAEAAALAALPDVVLHGYLDADALQALVARSHLFLYSTLAEGLGLPVLEAQFGGLPMVVNDLPILRETLGESALFIDVGDTMSAAAAIARLIDTPGALAEWSQASLANIARWNEQAQGDRVRIGATLTAWHAETVG